MSEAHGRLTAERDHEVASLEGSDDWSRLKPRDRARILKSNGLGPVRDVEIGTDQALIDCLEETSLKDWDDKTLALKARADRAREEAARLPGAQSGNGTSRVGDPEEPRRCGGLRQPAQGTAAGADRRTPRDHSLKEGSSQCRHWTLLCEPLSKRRWVEARDKAEDAARAALSILAVNSPKAFAALTKEQRALRNALRAKARQLAGGSQAAGFPMLVEEVAYAQWHRMLFARFLAENDLLMHPTGVAVTLDEGEELAAEEGDPDLWDIAARYAGEMLPGHFPRRRP